MRPKLEIVRNAKCEGLKFSGTVNNSVASTSKSMTVDGGWNFCEQTEKELRGYVRAPCFSCREYTNKEKDIWNSILTRKRNLKSGTNFRNNTPWGSTFRQGFMTFRNHEVIWAVHPSEESEESNHLIWSFTKFLLYYINLLIFLLTPGFNKPYMWFLYTSLCGTCVYLKHVHCN